MNKIHVFITVLLLAISGVGKAQCNAMFTSQVSGNTAQFVGVMPTNSGTNLWYFGDGTSSTQANPAHTYANCGVYTVWHSVEVVNPNGVLVCRDSAIQTINIVCNTPCSAVASFTANMVNNQPNVYQFTNTSAITPVTAPAVYFWSFGDGTSTTATTPAPQTHTYATSGLFNVCLIATVGQPGSTSSCRDTFCMNIQAQVPNPTPCNVNASFSSSVSNSVVQFVNTSTTGSTSATGTYSVWNFGDGSPLLNSPGLQNQVHTYTQAGIYTVCLKIISAQSNMGITCIDSICNTITIAFAPCNGTPWFSYSASTSGPPYGVTFINQSTPINTSAAVTWTFGDGAAASGYSVTHSYTQAGTYTVCMTATSTNGCVIDTCRTVVIASTPTPCNLQAGFSYTNSGYNYTFANTSVGYTQGDTLRWTFSNGTVTNVQSPTITFPGPGTYTVCLRVKKPTVPGSAPCVSEFCDSVTVAAIPCNIIPSFSYTTTSTAAPYVATFTNQSTPANIQASVTWSFGDGTSGVGYVATHTYTQAGTYTVCMTITSGTCVRDTCRTVVITGTPTPCNLQASYTYTNIGNTYTFANTTTGYTQGDTTRWIFSNGTMTNVQNPTVTFPGPGRYAVCLRVKKPTIPGAAPCVSEICDSVTVTSTPTPCNLQASFSATPAANQPNVFVFTNTSITANAPQVTWSFGDSTTGAGQVITHTFNSPGTYTVCMYVAISNTCSADTCITVTVNGTNPNPCNLQANFSWQQTPASPNVIYFQNTSVGYSAGDSVRWTFGDGTSSLNNNPPHTYAAPGVYNVCLRVKKFTPASSTPCVSEICRTITIAPPVSINCDSVVVSYNHYQDPMMANKIRFISVSNYPVNQQSWTITDLSAASGTPAVLLNQYNPAYVFPHTGDYSVCLRATTAGNCIKEYCDTINISSVATQCMLMAYPNPAHHQVSVNAVLPAPTTMYAFVFNSQNVLVNQRIVNGATGSNVITFNTSNLVSGYYTIRVYYNGQFCVARFQKL